MSLSAIDHMFLGKNSIPNQIVFHYKDELPIKEMKRQLESLSDSFWPLSGELLQESEETLIKKEKRDRIALKIVDRRHEEFNTKDLSQFMTEVKSVEGECLTKLTLFRYKNASFLNVCISHCIVDGFSYFYFLSFWAHSVKKNSNIFNSYVRNLFIAPQHKRGFFEAQRIKKFRINSDKWDEELFNKTGFTLGERWKPYRFEDYCWVDFDFQVSKLDAFLVESNDLSKHDLISAIVWKKFVEIVDENLSEDLALTSLFDFRRTNKKSLHRYFGNCIRGASVKLSKDEVINKPLIDIARTIRHSTQEITYQDSLKSVETLRRFRLECGQDSMECIHLLEPKNGILVSNISILPTRQLYFGTGAPVSFQVLTTRPNSVAILKSSNEIYNIKICLPITFDGTSYQNLQHNVI